MLILPAAAAFLGPIIGAGISAVGGWLTGKSQQKFAERMSSTAHQREVMDLRAAGLNPILSANRGASTPTPNIPHIAREAAAAGTAVGQLNLQKRFQEKQMGLMDAQTDLYTKQTIAQEAIAKLYGRQGIKEMAQAEELLQRAGLYETQRYLAELEQPERAAYAAMFTAIGEFTNQLLQGEMTWDSFKKALGALAMRMITTGRIGLGAGRISGLRGRRSRGTVSRSLTIDHRGRRTWKTTETKPRPKDKKGRQVH